MVKKLDFGKSFAYALSLFKNLVDSEFWSNTYLAWLFVIISNILVVFTATLAKDISSESITNASEAIFLVLKNYAFFILAILLLIIVKIYVTGWVAEITRKNKSNYSWKLKLSDFLTNPRKKFVEGLKLVLSFLLIQLVFILVLAFILLILFGIVYLFTKSIANGVVAAILVVLAILILVPIALVTMLIYAFIKIYFAHNFIVKGNFSKSLSFAWHNLRNKEFWKGFIVLLLPAILLGILFYVIYFLIYAVLLLLSFKFGAIILYMPYFVSFIAFIEYITFIFQMHLISYIRKQIGG